MPQDYLTLQIYFYAKFVCMREKRPCADKIFSLLGTMIIYFAKYILPSPPRLRLLPCPFSAPSIPPPRFTMPHICIARQCSSCRQSKGAKNDETANKLVSCGKDISPSLKTLTPARPIIIYMRAGTDLFLAPKLYPALTIKKENKHHTEKDKKNLLQNPKTTTNKPKSNHFIL